MLHAITRAKTAWLLPAQTKALRVFRCEINYTLEKEDGADLAQRKSEFKFTWIRSPNQLRSVRIMKCMNSMKIYAFIGSAEHDRFTRIVDSGKNAMNRLKFETNVFIGCCAQIAHYARFRGIFELVYGI